MSNIMSNSTTNGSTATATTITMTAQEYGGMLNRVGLGYGIAIAVGMMVFVCTMVLVCARLHAGSRVEGGSPALTHRRRPPGTPQSHVHLGNRGAPRMAEDNDHDHVVVIHQVQHLQDAAAMSCSGLDKETLESYPKFLYSARDQQVPPAVLPVAWRESWVRAAEYDAACAICLADYDDGDTLRLLPDCGHVFHAHCIDAWLHLHVSCPVCRSSPLPTPIATPLSELIPLARHPLG